MMSNGKIAILLAATAAVGSASYAAPVNESGRRFAVTLTGAAECNPQGTCNLGDPNGSGEASLVVNVGQQRICYELTVRDIELPATMAHIHIGASNSAGGVVQGLTAPNAQGTSGACIDDVSRDLLRAIVSNPTNYYVNVHNTPYPGGAVRGQLSYSPR
jgi:hypothetical protein